MPLWHFHFGRSQSMSIEADSAAAACRALMPHWRKANRMRERAGTALIPRPRVEDFHMEPPAFFVRDRTT